MGCNAKPLSQSNQPIAVAFTVAGQQLGMGRADNPIDGIGMAHDDRRQCLDHPLKPLARTDQAEGHDDVARANAEFGLELGLAAERPVGRAVRDHADQFRRRLIAAHQQIPPLL